MCSISMSKSSPRKRVKRAKGRIQNSPHIWRVEEGGTNQGGPQEEGEQPQQGQVVMVLNGAEG